MTMLFIRDEQGYHYDTRSLEINFPTELVSLLDQWESLITERKQHKQYIFKLKEGVFYFALNPKYHNAIRKEMDCFDNLVDYAPEYKVFAGRLHLLDS